MKATDWMTLAGMAVAGLGIGTIEAQSWVPVLLIGIGSAVIIAAMKLEKRKRKKCCALFPGSYRN